MNDPEIAVIVTFKDQHKGWDGSIMWQLARMRRSTYESMQYGKLVSPDCVVFEGHQAILVGRCGHLDSQEARRQESKEVERLSKLLGLPFLLRFRKITKTKHFVACEGEMRE